MGWTSQIIIANQVIIEGTNDGLFAYNGTPGPGTLFASLASIAGTDPYGNHYGTGLNIGSQPGSHFGVDIDGTVYIINAANQNVVQIRPNLSAHLLYSAAPAAAKLAVAIAAIAGTDQYGNTFPAGMLAPAVYAPNIENTSLSQPEVWHQVGGAGEPAFLNSWANSAAGPNVQFRSLASPPNTVELIGDAAPPAAGPNSSIFTLPAGYRPTTAQQLELRLITASGTPAANPLSYRLNVGTGGGVTAANLPTGTNVATRVSFHDYISLNA